MRLGLGRRHLEQPFLMMAISREERERFDGVLRRIEVGDAARFERRAGFAAIDRAEPRRQHGLRRTRRHRRHRTRGIGGTYDGSRHMQGQHRIHAFIAECSFDGGGHRSPATHRRAHRSDCDSRHWAATWLRALSSRRRKVRQRDAAIRRAVGRQRSGAAAVGDDRDPVAARASVHRQDPRRGKELGVRLDAHRAGALHRRVEDRVWRRRVDGSELHRPPCPQHDDRLRPRRGAQRRQEAPRVADRFGVEQDAVRMRDRRPARPAGRRIPRPSPPPNAATVEKPMPTDAAKSSIAAHTAPDCATSASLPAVRGRAAERRVQSDVGSDDAERVRSEHPEIARRRNREERCLPTLCVGRIGRRLPKV